MAEETWKERRQIFLYGTIDNKLSFNVNQMLLELNYINPTEDINLYINSPGGIVTEGLAIYDTIQSISNRVNTICIGEACSMAAIILSGGDKRFISPNARVLIHQPSGGSFGTAADMSIDVKEINRLKDLLISIMAHNTKRTEYQIREDTKNDFYLTPEEAIDYGIVDEIKK